MLLAVILHTGLQEKFDEKLVNGGILKRLLYYTHSLGCKTQIIRRSAHTKKSTFFAPLAFQFLGKHLQPQIFQILLTHFLDLKK